MFTGFFICCAMFAGAQVKCFAQTQMDRNTVYAQQPFKVTFTVLTATWYTAPLEFDNLQIPNAFIMPFDKTMPGMFTIKGQQYAGLQFYYIVFPYKDGHFTLPSINIVATTPAVGDSKAQKVNIKTQPLRYVVKPMPKNFDGDSWFVAKDAVIAENWNRPLKKLKVGDVLYRTVVVDAKGTLPQFIPDIKIDMLDWAGVYPQQPTLADTRNEYDANGTRTQTITYLLEKEGDFTIPQATVTWFNPNSAHVYKRSTRLIKIHVAANPNLGILKTLQDSLKAKQPAAAAPPVKHGPHMILGVPWYYFVLYAFVAVCLFYFVIMALISLYKRLYYQYKIYLASEGYWFKRFSRSSNVFPAVLKNLYSWWDHFPSPNKASSIQLEARTHKETVVNDEMTAYYRQHYAAKDAGEKPGADFKYIIKKYREKLKSAAGKSANKNINTNQTEWEG